MKSKINANRALVAEKSKLTKLFTLLTILTLGITQLWAAEETVPKFNNTWTGTSINFSHDEGANGSTSTKKDGDASNVTYVKFRTNKNGNTITLNVNDGYKVTGLYIRGFSNASAVETMSTVKYDDKAAQTVNVEFPSKDDGTTAVYSNTTDEATSAIVLSFSETNQLMAVMTITYEVTATVSVESITITPSPVSVYQGKTSKLTASVLPTNATDKAVTWAVTSGETYASVNETTGVVTGLAVGTATITATAHDGSGVTQTVAVNVEELTCPVSGEVFSMTVTNSSTVRPPRATDASNPGWLDLADYADISGYGEAKAGNVATGSDKGGISSTAVNLDGNDGVFWVALDCSLQEGDIITATITGNTVYLTPDCSRASGITLATGTDVTYTVLKDDKLEGVSNIYGWKGGGNAKISAFSITRPVPPASHALSSAVDPAGKGTVTLGKSTVAEGSTTTATYSAIDAAYEFDEWQISGTGASIDDAKANPVTITMGTSDATITLKLKLATTKYAITKGSHANGDFTISPAEQEENGIVTLVATPSTDYMFDAWEIVKTSDASATGITVDANGEFTMPGYPVTVNATFVADTRKKVLYVTNTAEATVKANDKLYAALKDIYNVSIVGFNSDADQTNYDLVVLHESVGGSNYGATAVAAAKTGSTPVLNTKSYFYNDGRWNWGTPNAGKSVKGCTPNAAYCNIANHPIFAGVIDGGFVEITDAAAEKCMQPIGAFTAGKEGYTLATTPNADSGDGCAIHELTPAQRGAASGKYLMISVSNAKLDALNANGQKLFQNAAAYLIDGSASWTPVAVPTNPEVEATPSENYTEGNTITLTASAEGISASTVYTWYKGVDWATASVTTPVQAASTSGATFTKTAEVEDAGTYWCNISNGTGCDVQASVTITVSSASTPTHSITYDNVKGADMSAYPTEYTEGVGVASFTPLADITGWHFVEWSPASIASDATTDQTITAVWAEVFEVTFVLQGHGATIDAQNIVDGGKVTKPDDPVAIGWDFGGWFTDAACTAGNEWDFDNDVVTAATPLYAKWTEFEGCVLLYPALSGDALHVGDNVAVQTGSKGGAIAIVGMKTDGSSIAYAARGLQMGGGSGDIISVTLNNDMAVGTKISVTLDAKAGGRPRGLYLLNGEGGNVKGGTLLGWPNDGSEEVPEGEVGTFSYTVEASDGLEGTNVFRLKRQNSTYIKCIKVESCGAAITYHNLTSEVNIAGKGTVTLGATSVREGYTTTATYSEIDPLYEFVNWTVSGAGASIADASANPATITMGTEDAVVTLNLRLIPVKFTVNYYDGTTLMGSEQVAVNEHPTASEIATAKRGYVFEGWAETDGASASDVVALNTITSDVAATIELYAVYTAVPCPTSGTVYKFQLKTDLTNGNVFNSKPNSAAFTTGNYLSELTGGTLTGAIDNNNVNRLQFYDNKAVGFASGSGGSLTIALDCALAEGDVIKYINYASSGNRMTLSDGTHTQTLDGNGKEEIQTWDVPAAWAGAMDLTLTRGGNTPKLTYFEIYRRPVVTGVTLSDLTVRVGAKKTPEMTLAPSADARVNSQAWTITSGDTYITIDAATGEITGVAEGDATVKVVLNDDPSISATATVHVVGSIAQQDVTKSTIWDWHNTGATANIQLTASSDPKKNEQFVLANVDVDNDEDFESDKLVVEGEHMVRDYDKANPYFQGQLIKFHTTVAGVVRVKFAHTGNATEEKPARELYINGVATGDSRDNATPAWSNYIEVPAGDVSITAHYVNLSPVATQQYIRVSEIEFFALGHSRDVTPGNLGTLCLPNACIARGVDVYELAGKEATYGKIVFADLEPDELLVAGQAYIFQVNEATARFYYAPGEPVDAPLNNTALKGNLGSTITFQPNSPEAENVYFVKDHALWSAKETGVNIGQYRAYLQMDAVSELANPSPAPGRRYIMLGTNGTNVATGIDDVQDDVRSTKMLIDGRLFILRGEKIYDATGRLVK